MGESSLKARIDALSEAQAKDILKVATEHHPGLILNILDKTTPTGEHHPSPSQQASDWCRCTRCWEMPTEQEIVCCNYNAENCFSQISDFELLILNEAVLELPRAYRQDVLAVPQDEDWRRGHRHTAYQQFVLWQHGRLGVGIRRVIPSCRTWKIRDRYPDAFGQYTGFQPSKI